MEYIPKPTEIGYVVEDPSGTFARVYSNTGLHMFMVPKASKDDVINYTGNSVSVKSGNIVRIYGVDGRIIGLA